MGFFRTIRERRLFQITAAYAASGWVALEVINTLIERGMFSELVYRIGFVWYLGGFVAAVVVGWYHGEKGRQTVARSELAVLGIVAVGVVAGTGVTVARHLQAARAAGLAAVEGDLDHRRIAVLYFRDAIGTDSLTYLADALTEALVEELAAIPSLDVLSQNGALQYRNSDLPIDSIARAVRAGTVVTGSVGRQGEEVVVNVALTDGESGAEFRRETLRRPASDLLGLSDGLAEESSRLLREWLGEEVTLRSERRGTGSVAAWVLVQRAERLRKDAETQLLADDLHGAVQTLDRADSLAAEAETVDGSWARPAVQRARIARRLAQLSANEPLEAGSVLQEGIAHADRALARDRRDADALENRGILRYIRWALNLEHDPAAAQALLRSAEEDLKEAVRADPTRADAWNALSIIHAQKPDIVESKIAARRAYEEDAYLRSADAVLWTLYATSYDLEQFPDAVEYCAEGQRRFPEDSRFVECELWLLASPAREPDVERAWGLLERYVQLVPPHNREYARARAGVVVGGVLARAGQVDSADAVFRRNRSEPSLDPTRELLSLEAVFRLQMGQQDEALRLIKTYLTASPGHREVWRLSSHWWWRPLQENAEFRELVGAGRLH